MEYIWNKPNHYSQQKAVNHMAPREKTRQKHTTMCHGVTVDRQVRVSVVRSRPSVRGIVLFFSHVLAEPLTKPLLKIPLI